MHDGYLRIWGLNEFFIGLRTGGVLSLNMIITKRKLNNKKKRTKKKEINQICYYHNFSAAVRMCERSHHEVRLITMVRLIALKGALECTSEEQN
jgi:hypothetical protein